MTIAIVFLLIASPMLVPTSAFGNNNHSALFRVGSSTVETTEDIAKAINLFESVLDKNPIDDEYEPGFHKDGSRPEDELTTRKTAASALFELSELLELYPHLSNNRSSLELLTRSADEGEPNSQHKLSVMLATGVGRNYLVPMDAGKSLLLEYTSALEGNPQANMGMGYRLLNGIGMAANCEAALPFYEYAANAAIEYLAENEQVNPDTARLSEVSDPNNAWFKNEVNEELIDYYATSAENGDVQAAMTLGNIFAVGTRRVHADRERAIHFLSIAADAKHVPACGRLGYLLAKQYRRERKNKGNKGRVDDRSKDIPELTRIIELLDFSRLAGDTTAQIGTGYIHLYGIGVDVNKTRAEELFQKFMGAHSDAGFYLGEIYATTGPDAPVPPGQAPLPLSRHKGTTAHTQGHADYATALRCYSLSATLGNPFAQHRLAHMNLQSLGTNRNCNTAAVYFRAVAEKGVWSQTLGRAHEAYTNGLKYDALQGFAEMAAIGYESAQFNAAYILSRCEGLSCPPLRTLPLSVSAESTRMEHADSEGQDQGPSDGESLLQGIGEFSSSECQKRALMLFGLSAFERNPEAFLQLGDFYYYKKGRKGAKVDVMQGDNGHKEAAVYYHKAADLRQAHALFNLGLMYEVGDGVDQDFHLAKRYYDLAAEVDQRARIPRDIAVWMLSSHQSLLELPWAQLMVQYLEPSKEEIGRTFRWLDSVVRQWLEWSTFSLMNPVQRFLQGFRTGYARRLSSVIGVESRHRIHSMRGLGLGEGHLDLKGLINTAKSTLLSYWAVCVERVISTITLPFLYVINWISDVVDSLDVRYEEEAAFLTLLWLLGTLFIAQGLRWVFRRQNRALDNDPIGGARGA